MIEPELYRQARGCARTPLDSNDSEGNGRFCKAGDGPDLQSVTGVSLRSLTPAGPAAVGLLFRKKKNAKSRMYVTKPQQVALVGTRAGDGGYICVEM